MNYILCDQQPARFYPLCLTRPISQLRAGILCLVEKWEKYLKSTTISYSCEPHLAVKFPLVVANDNVLIDSTLVANSTLAKAIVGLLHKQALVVGGRVVAIRIAGDTLKKLQFGYSLAALAAELNASLIELPEACLQLEKLSDLFAKNDQLIRDDFNLLTKGKKSEELTSTNSLIGKQLFIKKGAKIQCSILNTETGPIYIDKDAEVMEGSMLRGPLYIGKGAVIKMGAKIYGASTIGPESRVGGELSNSVIQGYSNKGHDGFLGNSVLGEWCNLGADTNTSNLKNNYGEVKLWDYTTKTLNNSGLQFCGLLMGDHSKAAINTQFNTGTSVGVMANVFKTSFPDKHIPSFQWLGDAGVEQFKLPAALHLAKEVMQRRKVEFTKHDEAILTHLAERQD